MNQNTLSMLPKNYQSVLHLAFKQKDKFSNLFLLKKFPKTNFRKRFSKIVNSFYVKRLSEKFLNIQFDRIRIKVFFSKILKTVKKIKKFKNSKNQSLLKERFLNLNEKLKIKKLNLAKKLSKVYDQIIEFINIKIIKELKSIDLRSLINVIQPFLERLFFSCLIFFIPFCFLANQAFLPQIVYKNELFESEGVAFILLSRFAILKSMMLNLVSWTRPWATDQLVLFLTLMAYLRVFAFSYDKLNIPLNYAFQGTVGFVYITWSYGFNLYNSLLPTIFDYYLIAKATICRLTLENRFAITPDYLDNSFYQLTDDMAKKFSEMVYDQYENLLILFSKNVTSILAFLSLCTLIYNIFYFAVKNKSPQIWTLTNAAKSMLKNREKNI